MLQLRPVIIVLIDNFFPGKFNVGYVQNDIDHVMMVTESDLK